MPRTTSKSKPAVPASAPETPKKTRSRKVATAEATVPAPEVTEEAVQTTEPKQVEANYSLGDYRVVVESAGETQSSDEFPYQLEWKLLNESDAVVASGKASPSELSYDGLKTVKRSARQVAIEAGIRAYNKLFPLEPGDVDIRRIYPSPINAMLYDANSSLEDLKVLLDRGIKLDDISVIPGGEILWGNTRFLAALQRNADADKSSLPTPHPTLSVRVVQDVETIEEKIEFIRQGNTYRVKTPEDLKREALMVAKNLVAKPLTTAGIAQAAKEVGMSQRQMENLTALEKNIKEQELPRSLARELRELAKKNPVSAVDAVRAVVPPALKDNVSREAYQSAIVEKIKSGTAVKGKPYSFSAAKSMVDKELLVESVADSKVKRALELGDKPENNRHTPPVLIEAAHLAMGRIDLDAFASLPNPGYVGEIVGYEVPAYTIEDNAFEQPMKGRVFANPPWSRATEAIAYIGKMLRRGSDVGISKCFLVIPVTVISSKSVQALLKDFGMMACFPDYRVEFLPGEVLKAVDPDVNTGNIRDVTFCLFYSSDEKDYDTLSQYFPGWCARQFLPITEKAPKTFEAIAKEAEEEEEAMDEF